MKLAPVLAMFALVSLALAGCGPLYRPAIVYEEIVGDPCPHSPPNRCTHFRTFEEAMDAVKHGSLVRRFAWLRPMENGCPAWGPSPFIASGLDGEATIMWRSPDEKREPDHPYTPTDEDRFASDWEAACGD